MSARAHGRLVPSWIDFPRAEDGRGIGLWASNATSPTAVRAGPARRLHPLPAGRTWRVRRLRDRRREGDDLELFEVHGSRGFPHGADRPHAVPWREGPNDIAESLRRLIRDEVERLPPSHGNHDMASDNRPRVRDDGPLDVHGRPGPRDLGVVEDVVVRSLVRLEEEPTIRRFPTQAGEGRRKLARVVPTNSA